MGSRFVVRDYIHRYLLKRWLDRYDGKKVVNTTITHYDCSICNISTVIYDARRPSIWSCAQTLSPTMR